MGIKILQQSKSQKQKAEAYIFFAKAADMGHLKAMEKMADALLFGNFGMQNITAAIQLFESLAQEGSCKAQNALGFLSSYGIGMEYNQAKALIYYTFGSAGGSMMSQMILKALYYFLKAAKAGSANAMAFIGKMYLEGNDAAPQNNATAFKYFSMAANKGNAIGLHGLGLLYFYGKGVPVLYKGVCELGHWAEKFLTAYFAYKDGDIDSSLIQYALLAEMGYEVAQSNSAFILESKKAKIIEKEKMYPMALLLWNRAAIQGNAFARVKIGDYHYYGFGTKKDYQTAAKHYSIAADKYHSAQAMFNLAYMYEHGLGIAKDIHLARRLYDMAAQTSPEANMPVLLALIKLETVHFLRDVLFFNFTMIWKWIKLDNTLGPYWDLFMIGLIVAVLIFLLRNRFG